MADSGAEIQEQRTWSKEIIEEYREHRNPPITSDIEIVWVLSGPGLYDPSISQLETYQRKTLSELEDRQRLDFAVELVREITALRLAKDKSQITKEDIAKSGPTLLYNGRLDQNENLRQASQKPEFPIPADKLKITAISNDLDPAKANTKTQFEKFPQDLLESALKDKKRIAVVSHLWHLPRARRTISAPNVLAARPLLHDLKPLFYAADRPESLLPKDAKSVTKRAVAIRRTVKDEGKRIPIYIKQGDLTEEPQ